jgi:hypothetical protein
VVLFDSANPDYFLAHYAASLPDDLALMAEMRAFGEAISREPAVSLIPAAFAAGWGQPGEFERNIGARIADLTPDK